MAKYSDVKPGGRVYQHCVGDKPTGKPGMRNTSSRGEYAQVSVEHNGGKKGGGRGEFATEKK